MGTLFELKRWLTVPQAAAHLSKKFGDPVTESDIYRLCLDHKLKLSAVFAQSVVKRFKLVEDESLVEYIEVHTILEEGKTVRVAKGGAVIYGPSGHMYQCEDAIYSLDESDAYDLVMIGGERCSVEEKYWDLMGVEREERSCTEGTFVSNERDIFQIQALLFEPPRSGKREYYPIGSLPETAAIVVRTSALLDLENYLRNKVEGGNSNVSKADIAERPLAVKERNSLLTIIAALCDYSLIAHQERGVAQRIVAMARDMTPPVSLDDGTVLKYLKQIPDALKA